MIAILVFAQVATTDFWISEEKSFAPYRACMLAQAAKLARTSSEVSALEAAARSSCRSDLAMVAADIALDAAAIAIEDSNSAHPVLHDPNSHFEKMKQEMSEDFTAAVVEARLNAPN